jgi:hypothetical protein
MSAPATEIQRMTKTITLPWMDEESTFAAGDIPEHLGKRMLFYTDTALLSFYGNFTALLPEGGELVTRLRNDGIWVVDVEGA